MLGETKFTMSTARFVLSIDPRQVAMAYAEKPRMRATGWLGIGLVGVAALLWFRR